MLSHETTGVNSNSSAPSEAVMDWMVDDASNVLTATFGVEMERAAVNKSMNDFKVISSPKFDYEMTDDVDDGHERSQLY
jgi:hypothetical protein